MMSLPRRVSRGQTPTPAKASEAKKFFDERDAHLHSIVLPRYFGIVKPGEGRQVVDLTAIGDYIEDVFLEAAEGSGLSGIGINVTCDDDGEMRVCLTGQLGEIIACSDDSDAPSVPTGGPK